jgi:hypothetical protein
MQKTTKAKRDGGVAQVVEHLPSNLKTLRKTPVSQKEEDEEEEEEARYSGSCL